MGFLTGLGLPTMMRRPQYYMQEGFVPTYGSGCDCEGLHGLMGSVEFNGSSSFIETFTVGGSADLDCSHCRTSVSDCDIDNPADRALTVGAWINSDDVTSSTIVAKAADATHREYALFFESDDDLIWRIYDEDDFNSGSGDNYIQRRSDATQGGLQNGWHWVVATYDGSAANTGMTIYVDGSVLATTGSENNGYNSAVSSRSGPIWGWDYFSVGGYFDGHMYNMAIWNVELAAGTITDLWNSGNSYIYQVTSDIAWVGPSDFSYSDHYTDQSTSGAVDNCENLMSYFTGSTLLGGVNMQDMSCIDCFGHGTNLISDPDEFPGSWTPNIPQTGVTEKIRIWLQNATNVGVAEWSNQATGDTAVDAEQTTSDNQAAVSGGGLDFDGNDNFYEFLDGSDANYDFDIAAQEGLTVVWVATQDATGAIATILSSGDANHYLQNDAGGNNLKIKLGSTETTITPSVTGHFAAAKKTLVTVTRAAGATGELALYINGVEQNLAVAVANPGDGEFDTLGARASNNYFNGKIFELVLWNRALNAAELLAAHAYFKSVHSL